MCFGFPFRHLCLIPVIQAMFLSASGINFGKECSHSKIETANRNIRFSTVPAAMEEGIESSGK
jgi:hypothetical protein